MTKLYILTNTYVVKYFEFGRCRCLANIFVVVVIGSQRIYGF